MCFRALWNIAFSPPPQLLLPFATKPSVPSSRALLQRSPFLTAWTLPLLPAVLLTPAKPSMGSSVHLDSCFSQKKSLPLSPASPHSRNLCLGMQAAGRDPKLSITFLKAWSGYPGSSKPSGHSSLPPSYQVLGQSKGKCSSQMAHLCLLVAPWPLQSIILKSPHSC